jgi:hypothetical protein
MIKSPTCWRISKLYRVSFQLNHLGALLLFIPRLSPHCTPSSVYTYRCPHSPRRIVLVLAYGVMAPPPPSCATGSPLPPSYITGKVEKILMSGDNRL